MLNLRLLDSEGRDRSRFVMGEQLTVEMNYVAKKAVEEPEFGLAIHRLNATEYDEPYSLIVHPHAGVIDGQGVTQGPDLSQLLLIARRIGDRLLRDPLEGQGFHHLGAPRLRARP